MLDLTAALISLSALYSFINYRYFRLPTTIGVMFIALIFSLAVLIAGKLGLVELEPNSVSLPSSAASTFPRCSCTAC